MALYLTDKKSILATLVLLSGGHAGLTHAEYGGYYTPPADNQAPAQYGYDSYPRSYGYDQGSSYMPYDSYNQAPAQYGFDSYPQSYGYDQGSSYMPNDSYNQGYNAPRNNQSSGYSSPWNNNGSGFNSPWNNNSSGFSSPWNNNSSGFSGPGNNHGSGFSAPWDNGGWGNGGRNPFGPRNPDQWMSPNKNNLSNNWDDMLNAPSRMGSMPGGWNAPSVSVPNPIDVGDEFNDAARDMPDQMDNFRYNR